MINLNPDFGLCIKSYCHGIYRRMEKNIKIGRDNFIRNGISCIGLSEVVDNHPKLNVRPLVNSD